jgi:hypothetical protein
LPDGEEDGAVLVFGAEGEGYGGDAGRQDAAIVGGAGVHGEVRRREWLGALLAVAVDVGGEGLEGGDG